MMKASANKRHTLDPSYTAKAEYPVSRGLSDQSPPLVEYWITRFRG